MSRNFYQVMHQSDQPRTIRNNFQHVFWRLLQVKWSSLKASKGESVRIARCPNIS